MKLMGIEAIYPKPNLSKPNSDHKVFPYLLRNMKIEKVNRSGEPSGLVNRYYLCTNEKRFFLPVCYC
jgi:uncharacterized protein affecting Mg2+/Co2+ transport